MFISLSTIIVAAKVSVIFVYTWRKDVVVGSHLVLGTVFFLPVRLFEARGFILIQL